MVIYCTGRAHFRLHLQNCGTQAGAQGGDGEAKWARSTADMQPTNLAKLAVVNAADQVRICANAVAICARSDV